MVEDKKLYFQPLLKAYPSVLSQKPFYEKDFTTQHLPRFSCAT